MRQHAAPPAPLTSYSAGQLVALAVLQDAHRQLIAEADRLARRIDAIKPRPEPSLKAILAAIRRARRAGHADPIARAARELRLHRELVGQLWEAHRRHLDRAARARRDTAIVAQVRQGVPQKALARRYGLSKGRVSQIVRARVELESAPASLARWLDQHGTNARERRLAFVARYRGWIDQPDD